MILESQQGHIRCRVMRTVFFSFVSRRSHDRSTIAFGKIAIKFHLRGVVAVSINLIAVVVWCPNKLIEEFLDHLPVNSLDLQSLSRLVPVDCYISPFDDRHFVVLLRERPFR